MSDNILTEQMTSEQEETFDTSDPVSVNTARKKSARTRADRLRFIEAGMQHEQGRSWFYDVLLFCHVFKNSFDSDPYVTAFKCGEHNVGLRILDDIQTASPENYLKMISENKTKLG